MRMLALITVVLLGGFHLEFAEASLKRISVANTNNIPSFINDGRWVTESGDATELKKLKDYAEQVGFKISNSASEKDIVIAALKWVNAQWDHDGMNQPPPNYHALDILKSVHTKKNKYRCVEYGIVLAELLQSYGFVTRTIALRTNEVAYGGYGQGHVAMEVWINDLNKWIFLDPQFGSYVTEKESKTPLNFYEIFLQKQAGHWEQLNIHFTSGKDAPKEADEYKGFLKNYFGHMKVSSGKDQPNICLLLEAKTFPLTFQGNASNNAVFTKEVSQVYPEMNRVTLLLSYRDQTKDFQKLMKDLNIKSDDDYVKNMSKFAAEPKFLVSVKSTISKVNGYEYRFEQAGKWTFTKDPEFKWDSLKKDNYLEVRGVNQFDRRGPITFIEIKYQ